MDAGGGSNARLDVGGHHRSGGRDFKGGGQEQWLKRSPSVVSKENRAQCEQREQQYRKNEFGLKVFPSPNKKSKTGNAGLGLCFRAV
jgi:hypothetical protein